MNKEDFDLCVALGRKLSGSQRNGVYTSDYRDLLKSALRAQRLKPETLDYKAAAELVVRDPQSPIARKFARALIEFGAHHESYFFREMETFTHLNTKVWPKLYTLRSKQKRLVIWSAACSEGQEAYSLAMSLPRWFDDWNVTILATDISEGVVRKARRGTYIIPDIRQWMHLKAYPDYVHRDWNDNRITIDPSLKRKVEFRTFNLLDDPTQLFQKYDDFNGVDVIFCRYLLLHLNNEAKEKVVSNLSKVLAADGVVYIGGSERHHATQSLAGTFKPLAARNQGVCFTRKKGGLVL